MPVDVAPWINRAGRVGSRPLAVFIARRLALHAQTITIPLAAIHGTLSPEIAHRMLRRMQAAGLLSYCIHSSWIEIGAWTTDDVF